MSKPNYAQENEDGSEETGTLKGIKAGPIIVPAGQAVTSIPKGTLIPLTTDPVLLPTTPLTGRKWIRFRNEDLVDIELCDGDGVVFRVLEPGMESPTYAASEELDFYGKVATGTADTGVRVEEGK